MRSQTKRLLTVFAMASVLLGSGRAEARSVLVSGLASDALAVRETLENLGWTVTRVAAANFATASFAGYDAIWLNSANWGSAMDNTFAGLASRKQDLIDFLRRGGNLLVEEKGPFSTNAESDFPFGEELTSEVGSGRNVRIIDPLNPVNADLANGGLSGWDLRHVYHRIGSFHAITENYDRPGEWVTIVKQVGRGHLIYTGENLAYNLVYGWSHLAPPQTSRLINNALSYPPCDMDPEAVPTQLDLSTGQVASGQPAVGQVTLTQPAGSAGVVVNLSSTDPAVLVPATVTVLPGAQTARFPITTLPVATPTSVTIIAGCALNPPTATLLVQPGSAGSRANLLVDGSFEEPDTTDSFEPWGYTYGLIPGYDSYRGTSIPGWQITRGTIDLVVYDWPPADGRQSIDLVGSPDAATIEQSFPTEPGRDYLFSGYVSHNPFLASARADVLLNGVPFTTLVHKLPSSHTDMKWVAFAYRFRATAATTRLTLSDTTRSTPVQGTALDGLSVRRDDEPKPPVPTPPGPPDAVPAAPSGLAVTAIAASQVSLIWDDNSNNETAFAIWRSDDGAPWRRVGVVPPNTTTFTDTGLTPGTRYLYGVRATNDVAASLWSNGAPAVTLP